MIAIAPEETLAGQEAAVATGWEAEEEEEGGGGGGKDDEPGRGGGGGESRRALRGEPAELRREQRARPARRDHPLSARTRRRGGMGGGEQRARAWPPGNVRRTSVSSQDSRGSRPALRLAGGRGTCSPRLSPGRQAGRGLPAPKPFHAFLVCNTSTSCRLSRLPAGRGGSCGGLAFLAGGREELARARSQQQLGARFLCLRSPPGAGARLWDWTKRGGRRRGPGSWLASGPLAMALLGGEEEGGEGGSDRKGTPQAPARRPRHRAEQPLHLRAAAAAPAAPNC